MKAKFNRVVAPLMVLIMGLISCDKDFEKINTDPINSPSTTAAQLLSPALVNTLTANMNRNRSFNNELMQVSVDISDGDGKVFRYDYRSSTSDYLWNSLYTQLTNFKGVYDEASKTATANSSYKGISLICQAWIYSLLTDTYGDIPYSESNQGRNGILEPSFDKQKDVYLGLFKQLEEANTLLGSNTAIEAWSDPLYAGDIAKWRKFGNSLYLRLLLRVSGKAEVASEAIAKIKEIVETNSTKYPVMAGNDDSAILRWTGVGPYTSPYMLNVRSQDFRTPAIASFFIDHLRDWSDPRINISTYGKNGVNVLGIAPGTVTFTGVPSGYAVGGAVTKQAYFYSYEQIVSSQPARSLQNDPQTGMIMNYSELQFILAEAALKGWISGSVQSFYTAGILSGITQWIPTYANSVNDQVFSDYLSGADIEWDDTQNTEGKMEAIHIQKYYSLFLADMQQWFEYRRTGHPILPKGSGLRNNGVMPARMVYPVYVQSANPTNYDKAVASQGADLISTEVWWQKD